jgi:YesN/AraC family two-component response regulator
MGKTIPVMIVDDEILAVEDLQNLIPWGQYGFEIVATATNSQKALDLYQKYHPRILFVDIRMPVMDGLELSRRIRLLGHPVKIILLTAFKDFDYARQALEIGVANYLLKHDINEASLLRELSKLKSELQNESRQNSILRQQFLRKILLHGEIPEDKGGLAGFKLAELSRGRLGLLLVARDVPYLEEFETHHPKGPVGMMDLENMELPEGIDWIEGVDLDGSKFMVITGMKKTNSHSEERDRLYQLALHLQRELKRTALETVLKTAPKTTPRTGRESFSIVIPGTCAGFGEVTPLYQKAAKTLDYLVFWGGEKILFAEDLPVSAGPEPVDPAPVLKRIPRMLQEADYPSIQEAIRELFNQILSPWDPAGLRTICNELIFSLEHCRKEHNLPTLEELFKRSRLDTFGLYSVAELQSWFIEQFRLTMEQIQKLKFGNYSKKVQQAVQQIHQYYPQDMSVDTVAEALGISGVYLSQIFKKETGQTFLEYLTEYRIGVARDLLERGGYKIYEVAGMVGYKTSQYFSQVFRKVTGMVPADCREGTVHHEGGNMP